MLGSIAKVLAVLFALVAIFIGGFLSGSLGKVGYFRFLASVSHGTVGLFPASLTEEQLKNAFKFSDIPDLTNHVSLVTGANVGLGYYTAYHLANKGSVVIMACRNMNKCNAAKKTIVDEYKVNADLLIPMLLDTSSQKSVSKFAKDVRAKFQRLDHTVFNAGLGPTGRDLELSEDGLELLVATNHMGHFQLYDLIHDIIESTAEKQGVATIVSVSSSAHYSAEEDRDIFDLAALNNVASYSGYLRYGTTKLFNVLFSNEIAKRMKEKNINVLSNAIHPGVVATEFGKDILEFVHAFPEYVKVPILYFVDVVRKQLWTAEDGALTQVYAAVSKDIVNNKMSGNYYHPIAIANPPSKLVTKENEKKLWDFSSQFLSKKKK